MNLRFLHSLLWVAIAWALIHAGPPIGHARLAGILTIAHGGTYAGQWKSDDPAVPVILVKTAEAVVIENSMLRGRGALIQTGVEHANVTVRNTRGAAVNPNVSGKSPGRFFSAESFDSIVIENNDLEGTAGIYLLTYSGKPGSDVTVRIIGNRAHNIDGRHSDGAGGFLPVTDPAQFVQLDKVRHVPHIEIAWNQIINQPGSSGVEDVINIYLSSGTTASPIRIHDNFIRGAYPTNLAAKEYSGGGIMLGDGHSETPDGDSAFVDAYDNQVLDTTNYGIATSAGHDCSMHDNRIVSSGVLPDGTPLPAQNVGAYIWNANGGKSRGPKTFANNSGRANRIGWVKAGGRNDWWVPDAKLWNDNIHWPGPITPQALEGELAYWDQKLKQQKIVVGAR